MKELMELMKLMSDENPQGTDLDIIPEGFGEFGIEITNPVPVNSVFGSTVYLKRLITNDGNKIEFKRRGSMSVNNIENPIDAYIISVAKEKIATIYISPYHKKISQKAPKGFKFSKVKK
ncbi:MAG: hypothetical protein L3J35_05505 [Bacteroidales bacterium]|nr:hypothetical protein [Bacteroidales bacterium]